jgi:LmbE family N-acetylglucosaminyl deacetylase
MASLLCLVAHPDDETMLCGGTQALLAARGVETHMVCLTRGEGGELGEPPRSATPRKTRSSSAAAHNRPGGV